VIRRAALLGSPVSQSPSPALHRAAYLALGLPEWRYDAFDVAPAGLAGFLDRLDDSWAGVSLTGPLQSAALSLVDEASPLAVAVGAADTVLLGSGRRRADTAAVPALVAALLERGVGHVERASVLGGGGRARVAVAALAGVAPCVTAYVRSAGRVDALQRTADTVGLPLEVAGWDAVATGLRADLVVTTLPRAAADLLASRVPDLPATLLDVVDDEGPTRLSDAWRAAGGVVVSGSDLRVHGVVRQVALMTGVTLDLRQLLPRLRRPGEAVRAGR
jgi:shikimate dehydrogenase